MRARQVGDGAWKTLHVAGHDRRLMIGTWCGARHA
jgi:hypothetical protein